MTLSSAAKWHYWLTQSLIIIVQLHGPVSFQWKKPDCLFRNPDFLLKNLDFIIIQVGTRRVQRTPGGALPVSKNEEFCNKKRGILYQKRGICITNEDLCIKNEEVCIKNEELCIKMMDFARDATTNVYLLRGICMHNWTPLFRDVILGPNSACGHWTEVDTTTPTTRLRLAPEGRTRTTYPADF